MNYVSDIPSQKLYGWNFYTWSIRSP